MENNDKFGNSESVKFDDVNHPPHYTWLKEKTGVEVIDITRELNFNLGNVIKYVLRSGKKVAQDQSATKAKIKDLHKAIFYLNDEIKRIEK